MDKTILNGNKLRLYNSGNTESGSIKFDSGNISIQPKISSSGTITAKQITSSIASGTPPFSVSSNTVVTNLNSDLLDNKHASDFLLLTGGTLTGDISTSGNITAKQFTSSISAGTPPFKVTSNTVVNNLNSDLLDGTHSTGFLSINGGTLTGDISTSGNITAKQFTSSIAAGIPPFSVSSNTVVTNLNSDLLDGKHSSDFLLLSGGIITGNLNVNGNTTLGDAPSDVITLTGQTTASNGVSSSLFNASIGYTSSTGYLKLGGVITASNIQLNNPLTTVGTAILEVDNSNIFRKRTFAQIISDMNVVPSSRTLTFGGTSNQISITPSGAQDLTANRSWTVGFPTDISILGSISAVTGYTSSAGYVKVGGDIVSNNNLSSPSFISGFNGTGWMISKSTIPSTRYTAIFDDLWVRGSMNVYEMVINQIRSTNGSLWISDASKATSASYSSAANALILQFQTGSLVPFIAGDIIRSKRWGTSGSTILSQWDITTTISNINYITGYATISAPLSNNDYTITGSSNGSWTQLAQKLSVSGSQWVRVGNISQSSNRRGSIYLTSNDLGGPFIDVYDNVTSSVEATGGSGNVSGSKTKVRLGNLSGITDLNISPNPLSGYGLYADNVYLRGTVSATQGTFSGTVYARDGVFSGSISSSAGQIADWSIQEDNFNNGNLYLGQSDFYSQDGDIFIGAVNDQGYINFGNKLIFSNSSLAIDGTISAEAGTIGGWTINPTNISTSGIIINSYINPYIGIGTSIPGSNGIWIGHAVTGKYIFQAYKDSTHYIQWDGDALGIVSNNFTLSKAGNISASNATLGGYIEANTGYIGGSSGWIINSSKITSSGIELLGGSSPAIKIGASDYAGNGIWFGKGNYYSASFWNTANARGLKWDGQNLLISASNFTLSTAGNISASNAILSGTIYANNGNFNGSITSSTGTIGGWNLTTDALTSGNTTISSKANSQSIKFTTASTIFNIDTSQNFIYLGKYNNNNYFYLVKDSTQYFKWDGNGLKIKQTNFTLSNGNMSASNAILGGTINALSGNIGGWNIDTYKLISQNSNIILSPQSPSPYIGICATSYTDEGIWIGSINEKSKFSIVNSGNTSKFLFDGSNIGISTSNFTLSQGNIIAKNAIISGSISAITGYIGGNNGWIIDTNKISSSYGIEFSNSIIPAIKLGAIDYGNKGIWIGKGSDNNFSMSIYNNIDNYLKWNGQSLQIKTNNFTLSSAGNISASNAILSGTIYANAGVFSGSVKANNGEFSGSIQANNGQFSGSIKASSGQFSGSIKASSGQFSGSLLANSGYIGGTNGWVINTNKITSSNGIEFSNSITPSIKLGASNYGQKGIWLGKGANNNFSMSLYNDINNYLRWNGSSLQIKSSKLTLDNSSLILTGSIKASSGQFSGSIKADSGQFSGSIKANSGYIGGSNGWQIASAKLNASNNNIILQNDTSNPYISIGNITSYDQAGGIWIGRSLSLNKLSLKSSDATNYLRWNGSSLQIKSNKLTLDNSSLILTGSINSTTGNIGGWNLNPNNFSSPSNKFVINSNDSITISSAPDYSYGLKIGCFPFPTLRQLGILTQNLDLSIYNTNSHTFPNWFVTTCSLKEGQVSIECYPDYPYQYTRLLMATGDKPFAYWENQLIGTLNYGDKFTASFTIYANRNDCDLESSSLKLYLKDDNGNEIASKQYTDKQLNDIGAYQDWVQVDFSLLISSSVEDPKIGYRWYANENYDLGPLDLLMSKVSLNIIGHPKSFITDNGMHFQYGDINNYIRLSENQSKISNAEITSSRFYLGKEKNIYSDGQNITIKLGKPPNTSSPFLKTTPTYFIGTNYGVELKGNGFAITNSGRFISNNLSYCCTMYTESAIQEIRIDANQILTRSNLMESNYKIAVPVMAQIYTLESNLYYTPNPDPRIQLYTKSGTSKSSAEFDYMTLNAICPDHTSSIIINFRLLT